MASLQAGSSHNGFHPPPPPSSSTSSHHFHSTATPSSTQHLLPSSSSRATTSSGSSHAPPKANGSVQQRVVAPLPLASSAHHLPPPPPPPASHSVFEDTLCKYILLGGRGCYGQLFETRKAALAFVKSSIKTLVGVDDRRIEFLIDSCPVLEGIWLRVMQSELARGTGYLEISIEVEQEEGGEGDHGFEVKQFGKKAKLSHPAPPAQLHQPSHQPSSRAPLPPQHQPGFVTRPDGHAPPFASAPNSQFFRQSSISSHSRTSSTASASSDAQAQPRRQSQSRQPSLPSSHGPLVPQPQFIEHQHQHQQRQPPPPSRQSIQSSSVPYSAYQPPPGLSFSPSVIFQQPVEPPQQQVSSSRPNPPSNAVAPSRGTLPDGWTGSPPAYVSSFPSKVIAPPVGKEMASDGTGGEEKKEKKQRKPSPYNHFYATAYPRVKLARPDLENAEIIREVAKQWAEEPDNPKNLKANRRDERPQTLYSEFYTVEYAREKAAHPEVPFEERNRTVAELWAESPRNPKNFSRDRDPALEAHAAEVALRAIQAVEAVAGNGNTSSGDERRFPGEADGMGDVVEALGGGEGAET